MTQEDDIASIMASAIQQEIDAEVLADIHVSNGWTMVFTLDVNLDDVGPWMQENIHKDWRAYSGRFVFESAEEALLFKMRWT